MKILLIHKFHYMLGGTETFHYNLAEALTAAGHEVIFFSMYDKRNIPCAQDKYFVSNVDYNDPNLSTFKKIKMGICVIIAFLFHTSSLLILLIYLLYDYIVKGTTLSITGNNVSKRNETPRMLI
jgi:hypothetical protein